MKMEGGQAESRYEQTVRLHDPNMFYTTMHSQISVC